MSAVRVKATEAKCKLCVHPERRKIDELLFLRSQRGEDEHGNRVTLEYALSLMATWGVVNPTKENVTNHWKKHCEVVSGAVAGNEEALRQGLIQHFGLTAERIATMTYEEQLDWLSRLGMAGVAAKIEAGEDPGISPELAIRAIDALTRRKTETTQARLMDVLGAGITQALIRPHEIRQIGSGEVIDQEDAVELPAGS